MKRATLIELSLVGFLGAGALTYFRAVPLDRLWRSPAKAELVAEPRTSEQLVLVYIGAMNCDWSNEPNVPRAILRVKQGLAAIAARHTLAFVTVGVASDRRAADGWAHLQSVGGFDEIFVGYGELNTGMLKYVYHQFPGPPATPSLVVLRRTATVGALRSAVVRERLVARFVGAGEIETWVTSGFNLPAEALTLAGAR